MAAWAAGEAPAIDQPETAGWDQVASIRGAAERLGRLHRAKGAKAAYELIDNCYKTHSLSSKYGEGFESCIAQDYLETRTLVQVYSRMPPEMLEKHGVPSPQMLAESMGKRISMAFGQYKKSQAYADNVKRIVDEHGLPVFLALVFPEAVKAVQDKQAKEKEKNEPR
ncbi:hypothetical protein [Hyphomicrobium sp. CS1GBMeth3]|uniref:hypothetical protein n=1 Tax=Hyphomicrobium sp. CS1GBMeth3 TaxID=1892845 RepID=UPI000931268F|nr:hypothetical protein [Hyphomicrobium sp. CS1GBMeth3]